MSALGLGLIAALCWGFHDICVRFLSQKVPVSACIVTVTIAGLLFHAGLITVTGEFHAIPPRAIWLCAAAGLFFVIATFGLYYAFQRGPVRLVAPLIAGFPILAVGLAAAQGVAVSGMQWAAVLAIVGGVGLVAALSDTSTEAIPPKGPTVLYAVISAFGFAGMFAFGQQAAVLSHEMPTTLLTRAMALGLITVIFLALKQPFWPGKPALPLLIAMGVADGLALLCVMAAGNYPNPQYAVVTSSIFGLLTVFLAWVWLKERMSPPQWLGCLIAFGGVGYLAL